jgi:hypothetical protein
MRWFRGLIRQRQLVGSFELIYSTIDLTGPDSMNVEYNRLATFSSWPSEIVAANPDANPATLAKFGFFYQPKSGNAGYYIKEAPVQDRAVNFCCKVRFF